MTEGEVGKWGASEVNDRSEESPKAKLILGDVCQLENGNCFLSLMRNESI